MSARGRELPLFPLGTVLFPDGPLPLRIFEPRYLDMVKRCLRTSTGFGVVLLTRGREAGGPAETVDVGTEARIVDFDRLQDGLLGLKCLGQGRFRVLERWRAADGLNVARVEDIPAPPARALPPHRRELRELLERVLPELGEVYAGVPRRYDDADWVGCRLAELLPLALPDKQALLELDDPLARLDVLAPLVARPGD